MDLGKKFYLKDLKREAPRIPELAEWCRRHHYEIGTVEDGEINIHGER